jgi:hypothetical protein
MVLEFVVNIDADDDFTSTGSLFWTVQPVDGSWV